MTHKTFPSTPRNKALEEPILEHGFRLFAQNGVKGFTVETLAKDLAMSKKTIYKYFPTKEILLQKIFQYILTALAAHFDRVRGKNINPLDKFVNVMGEITKTISKVSITRINEMKARYPAVWKDIESFRLARRADFFQIMQEGQTQGYVREDLDLEIAATLFMNIINSVFQPEFFLANQLSPKMVIEIFRDIFLRGIVTHKGLKYIEEKL
ncbi:MAG: TetR/AcrR family transcriptional regulator [Candidatus Marinimicrobia bacterium]|nr:TetR/AcrR family transcriptional regulator [Candidatus Neomarinimicrobiota bacterium]